MRTVRVVMILVGAIMVSSCVSVPQTFVRTMEPGWNNIEIRAELEYGRAWDGVVDLIARRFDIDVLSKDDGYLRTGWLHSWTGELDQNYRVRAIIKFDKAKHTVGVKSEAQLKQAPGRGGGLFAQPGRSQGTWVMGTDERLMTTMRSDIMGVVGRVTR